jgi:hypothetical protein
MAVLAVQRCLRFARRDSWTGREASGLVLPPRLAPPEPRCREFPWTRT